MESINIWIVLFVWLHYSNPVVAGSRGNQIAAGLFVLHYFNRSLIYPFRLSNPNPMSITVMLAALSYCSWNGFNQALSLLILNKISDDHVSSPVFLLGVVVFFVGFFTNLYADHVLLNLRKPGDKPGSYKIPSGGIYEYISCPNYGKLFLKM